MESPFTKNPLRGWADPSDRFAMIVLSGEREENSNRKVFDSYKEMLRTLPIRPNLTEVEKIGEDIDAGEHCFDLFGREITLETDPPGLFSAPQLVGYHCHNCNKYIAGPPEIITILNEHSFGGFPTHPDYIAKCASCEVVLIDATSQLFS